MTFAMSESAADPNMALQSGFAALQSGAPQAARDIFGAAIRSGLRDPDLWFGLSVACRQLGAWDEEFEALNRALAMESRHLPALIAKGDWYARANDSRAASAFYGSALNLAAMAQSLPPHLRRELDRIAAAQREFTMAFEAHLRQALDGAGVGEPGTERFAHALDLLFGKRELYLQQPKYFYYPELPQIQFYPRAAFPWAAELEAATDAIRQELRGVLAERAGIEPYIRPSTDRPRFDGHVMENNPDWSACYLIRDGQEVADIAARCPRTLEAVRRAPLCRIDGRTPSVLFSLLAPGARIPPHHGFTNARLICHLPLVVPPDCGLRVGDETHVWREGELVAFDDSFEHEAWNGSDALRVVLIFDIWKPELTEQERALTATLLSSIRQFNSGSRWTD